MCENNQDKNHRYNEGHARVFILVALLFIAALAMFHLPEMSIGDYQLRKVAILSDLIDSETTYDELPPTVVVADSIAATDSTNINANTVHRGTTAATTSGSTLIDYSNGGAGGMAHFYQCLDNIQSLDRPVRIAYYGDSFIEGDILTADIRDILQQKYGGNGVGWVDCAKGSNAFRPTIGINSKGLTPHLTNQKPFDNNRQGPNQKYYTANGTAQLTYNATNFRGHSSAWQHARLFFVAADSVTIRVTSDTIVSTHHFAPSTSVQCLHTIGQSRKISYSIDAGSRTSIWGATLEPDRGIVVDNLGIRGISGTSLHDIPAATLQQMSAMRPYDLIVLHYGSNLAIDGNPDSYLKVYTSEMAKVVEKFRVAFPVASIIVCGVADRDQRTANGIHTANAVRRLSHLQRIMASNCGVAFYDLYNAMGGSDAMVSFVDKGWANKDYTHVNFDGGRELAKIFCRELDNAKNGSLASAHVSDKKEIANVTQGIDTVSTAAVENNMVAAPKDICHRLMAQLAFDRTSPLIFCSGMFLVLFFLFTLIYYQLSTKTTAKLLFVTIFSYYFYYKSSGMCFLLLALVTTTDYWIARLIAQRKRSPRLLLAASIVIDLGLLFYFKYTNFFASIVADIAGCDFNPFDIVLPVGISFFTFQSMSYTIDVYRQRLKPVGSLLDYAFYVSFFPQLVAGPIVRARDFIPQIRRNSGVSQTMIARGVFMIAIGLFKKAVISDYISLNFVDRVFDSPLLYTGFENLLAIYGYTLQIYCDFSGYSDMAIGIALLLGFHFPDNFNAPFKSTSVSEFWHRWHISLSSWIRDYVYIAFGGNRHGTIRTYINLLASMLLCGLWHGASFTFIIWGGIHGMMLALHKFFRTNIFHHDRHYVPHGIRRVGGMLFTFHVVALLFMVFRMPNLSGCMQMIDQVLEHFHLALVPHVVSGYWAVISLVLFGYVTHFVSDHFCCRCIALLKKGGLPLQVLLLAAILFIVVQVKSSEIQPFIYFQF